jgi:putative PIG3 family NAD(P)H quinone oxidoreductase
VQEWKTGDRVCALVNGGGYSNACFAPATQCLPWPQHYSATEAACLPEALFTVWHNVFQRGQLKRGDNVLVQAGSSGIGTTAIQLATLAGAHVFTTAGSAEKCARCTSLGAEIAIDYTTQDFLPPLLAATQPHGMDLVLDILGGDTLGKHIKLAALDGHIVNIAVLDGARTEINLASLMTKRLTLTGSTLRAQSTAQKAAIATDIRQKAWHWIDSAQFRPVIDSVFGFGDVERAHQRMQSREHVGKIAIEIKR